MGTVQQRTGFINDPFFNRTLYPLENTGGIASLARNNGAGNAVTSALPADFQQYQYLALNNEGSDTRYLYGVKADGSETNLGIYASPFVKVGIQVISQDKVDNPNQFVLQNTSDNSQLIFSNSTLPTGSNVTFTPVEGDYAVATCFTTSTLIRTARGEVAVEALQVGDLAVTASGALRPITWIGHRALEAAGKPLPHDQQPVRIRAGAFGHGLPARELRLSPGHPVLVGADENGQGGVLVPVMCLINGTSIGREAVTSVTYWHVELDAHDILLAEGLPAESYLDWGDRPFFDEASDHALHNPDFVRPGLSARCRPVAVDGPLVEAERARLDAVFAIELAGHSAWGAADSHFAF